MTAGTISSTDSLEELRALSSVSPCERIEVTQRKNASELQDFKVALSKAMTRRRAMITPDARGAFRAFSGAADGVEGVYVDVYGPGAAMIVYEGRTPRGFDAATEAASALDVLAGAGVRAVYHKPFAKDRSRMGGELPPEVTDAKPAAGEQLPEWFLIREHEWELEIRLYDGLSTGLFLDQRENRAFVAQWVRTRASAGPVSVLNTFAYTCAFSIAAAKGGAETTSVDVSARYLDWGKRNFAHNAIDIASGHRFAKMDTFEFFGYARRKALKYDLIILDPPSFASGNKRKGIRAWNSVDDYARLVGEAAGLLKPKGVIFASTNTQELCQAGRFEREIAKGLAGVAGAAWKARGPQWLKLPGPPADFAGEKGRFAARAFGL
jgi:23S rRNA (cytosine1962-C5)-methyltransferase